MRHNFAEPVACFGDADYGWMYTGIPGNGRTVGRDRAIHLGPDERTGLGAAKVL